MKPPQSSVPHRRPIVTGFCESFRLLRDVTCTSCRRVAPSRPPALVMIFRARGRKMGFVLHDWLPRRPGPPEELALFRTFAPHPTSPVTLSPLAPPEIGFVLHNRPARGRAGRVCIAHHFCPIGWVLGCHAHPPAGEIGFVLHDWLPRGPGPLEELALFRTIARYPTPEDWNAGMMGYLNNGPSRRPQRPKLGLFRTVGPRGAEATDRRGRPPQLRSQSPVRNPKSAIEELALFRTIGPPLPLASNFTLHTSNSFVSIRAPLIRAVLHET